MALCSNHDRGSGAAIPFARTLRVRLSAHRPHSNSVSVCALSSFLLILKSSPSSGLHYCLAQNILKSLDHKPESGKRASSEKFIKRSKVLFKLNNSRTSPAAHSAIVQAIALNRPTQGILADHRHISVCEQLQPR